MDLRGANQRGMAAVMLTLLLFVSIVFSVRASTLESPTVSESASVAASGPTLQSDETLSPEEVERALSKMDGELVRQVQSSADEPLSAIINLGGRADLSPAARMNDSGERAAFVYQTLQDFAGERQADLRQELATARQAGVVVDFRPFFIVNSIAVETNADTLLRLALRDDVQEIVADAQVSLHQDGGSQPAQPGELTTSNVRAPGWNIELVRADEVWSTYNITGTGVVVANIDSGVQHDHPALVNQYAGTVSPGVYDHNYHWYVPIAPGSGVPFDDNGHGTHTMGTMVGGDGPGPFADDIGMAPGATWIAVKAFDNFGFSTASAIHLSFEWLLAPCPIGVEPGGPACNPARAPDVVNNSWGINNPAYSQFVDDVYALEAAGIWVGFSAGNSGPAPGTISSPASFDGIWATGAVDENEVIADFSSRGPSPVSDEIKPVVVAPGVAVRSSVPNNGYDAFNGTSMASPHTVGLAALLLSAAPDLNEATINEIIISTSQDLGDPGPDMIYGYGRIDALAAMERVLNSGEIAGVVSDSDTTNPIPGVSLVASGNDLTVAAESASDGSYGFTYLPQGVYTITAEVYGYEDLITATTVISEQVTTLNIGMDRLPFYTITGHVYDAVTTTIPITNASVQAINTPLPAVQTDANGAYTLTAAIGEVVLEAAQFGYATGVTSTQLLTDTVIDFYLQPLPPVLLVDDDEGSSRVYSPHVEESYFVALDTNGYNYTYWDLEEQGSPDYDTVRQYAAVVWFGGEWGRVKDISDQDQAGVLMDYLDIGGRLLYVAQSHTFYYGDDTDCDGPSSGGPGPCHFSEAYLGLADFIEDQRAGKVYGVEGHPVGDGIGPVDMVYTTQFTDFSDKISGTITASLAFTASYMTETISRTHPVAYSLLSPTSGFKTVYMATPIEMMPATDAADVVFAVLSWFGVDGIKEGVTLSPSRQSGLAEAGEVVTYTLRVRNLNDVATTYDINLIENAWETTIWDESFSQEISEIGPIPGESTMDFGVRIVVPASAAPADQTTSRLEVVAQGPTPYRDETEMTARSRMTYYVTDSNGCGSPTSFEWLDATGGDRYDLDESIGTADPEWVQVPLPSPFEFYNESYDHIYVNAHGTVLFGDDNIYDDYLVSDDPPIPNPYSLDPNGAIYAAWGTSYWHPSGEDPDKAVYVEHDTVAGHNRLIIEYYLWDNLLGEQDTFEIIMDLDSYEITIQYLVFTYDNSTVVGIENQTGEEGILYVSDQIPVENRIHNGLAVHFGLGDVPLFRNAAWDPASSSAHGNGTTVTHTLSLSNTGNLTDTYDLSILNNSFATTIWDATFSQPITQTVSMPPCTSMEVGVAVEVPSDSEYIQDVATLRARSQGDTLLVTESTLLSDNAEPGVAGPGQVSHSGIPGDIVTHTVTLTNTGNFSDSFVMALGASEWSAAVAGGVTQTVELESGETTTVQVEVLVPAQALAGETDVVELTATSARDSGVFATIPIMTTALAIDQVDLAAIPTVNGNPGEEVIHTVTIRNNGNVSDSYDITLSGFSWPSVITPAVSESNELPPGGQQQIKVAVTVAQNALAGTEDTFTLIVESQGYAATDSIDLNTRANALPAISPGPDLQQDGLPGWTLSYVATFTNTGNLTDDFGLSLEGFGWFTRFGGDLSGTSATILDMAPGAIREVTVLVTLSSQAQVGTMDQAMLVITSQANAAVQETILMQSTAVGIFPGSDEIIYLPLLVH